MEIERELGNEKNFESLDSEKILFDEINRFKERVDRHLDRCEDEISIEEKKLEEKKEQLQKRRKDIEEKRLQMLNLVKSFGVKEIIEEPMIEEKSTSVNYSMADEEKPYSFEDNLRKVQGDN